MCKSCRSCFKFYCMFCFTCDRSFNAGYTECICVECRNLIHQLIEPNPELRVPMDEIQANLWITNNGKCPFVPYTAPVKNRTMRSQVGNVIYPRFLTGLNETASDKDKTRTRSCRTRKRAIISTISVSPICCDNVDMLTHLWA